MSDLDDLPLLGGTSHSPHTPGLLVEPAPQSRRVPVLLIAAAGVLLGAAGAWWWSRDTAPPGASAPTPATTEAALPPASDQARPLPPLDQMDIFLRALLGSLSASPELARWLATDDLIRQIANGIDRVSRGLSPASELSVLRPQGTFETAGRGGVQTVHPASYRRFDGLAALIGSLDARTVATVYRTIQPRLDEAYRGLGRTEGSVDAALSQALQILLDTPRVDGPIRLAPGPGATLAYADDRLEALAPAQKQLLRMGPRHLDTVRARLREIKDAIDTSRPR